MNNKRKGVTPVIATVLLITIAIAAVSSAAVFFTEISDQITGGVEDRLSQEERVERSSISIENGFESDGNIVLEVRNTGEILMPVRENNADVWSIFLDGQPQDAEDDWEYTDSNMHNEEEIYLNPQETVRIELIDSFPENVGDTEVIQISGPYESGTSITCYNSGDQSC